MTAPVAPALRFSLERFSPMHRFVRVVSSGRRLCSVLAITATLTCGSIGPAAELRPRVEVEEVVYRFESSNNGSSPMWCHGNTCIVRLGDQVFVSGRQTIPEAKPLNNCLTTLFHRDANGWTQRFTSTGRTREPSPLALFHDGRVFLSVNPTMTEPDTYNGPSRPEVLEFDGNAPSKPPQVLAPVWQGQPSFSEHSYRSFAADGQRGELILFQNIGHSHAEWSFRDRDGNWSAAGKLIWPYGKEYEKPQPIRTCYPAVAIRDRAVYFCGVSDIVEPNSSWKSFKHELTGRAWDYDFRRLFFTWCPDITTEEFSPWIEVASREETGGHITPCDLHVDPDGQVRLLWTEKALDERLKEKFFPDAKQRFALMYGVVKDGKVVSRIALAEGGDGIGGAEPGYGRFHVTGDGKLIVFYFLGGSDDSGNPIAEHRIVEIGSDGRASEPVTIPLKTPLKTFFTATDRAGNRASNLLDVFGESGGAMHYARIRLAD